MKASKWEFADEFIAPHGITTIFFTTKNKKFIETKQNDFGMAIVELHDYQKIDGKKIMFGNFKSGLFIWEGGAKRYLHRYFLETDGKDLTGLRVGFIDGNPFNLLSRNLFTYEEAGKPLLNKWKARKEALEKLERQGLARKVIT